MSDTPLTLAETASVFGEMLTFRALLAAERRVPSGRKVMLAGKVEDMLNTGGAADRFRRVRAPRP